MYLIKNNHVNEITNHTQQNRLQYLYIALMGMVIIHTHKNKKKISYPFPGSFYPAAQLEFLNCYAKLTDGPCHSNNTDCHFL